jgi:23S rRNA (adenine2030-N6)-methyltransferase
MNYRHAYHAGNFGDVVKHAVLARIIDYLKRKEAPFRCIDTHAGAGLYALNSPEAEKTGEWRVGIGRLLGPEAKPLAGECLRFLAPYLDAVRAENPSSDLVMYPGSARIARRLMRPTDTLVANELHPEARAHLKAALARAPRTKVMALDGWVALKSLLPPPERRGLVLIDPPFEEPGETERLADGLSEGLRRFNSGVFLLWYPIKDEKIIARFHSDLAARGHNKLLCLELRIRADAQRDRLKGCGLVIANPPYTLEAELSVILPELSRKLAAGPQAQFRVGSLQAVIEVNEKQMRRRRPLSKRHSE